MALQSEIDGNVWFLQGTPLNASDSSGNVLVLQKIFTNLANSGPVIVQDYIHQLAEAMVSLENLHSILLIEFRDKDHWHTQEGRGI